MQLSYIQNTANYRLGNLYDDSRRQQVEVEV